MAGQQIIHDRYIDRIKLQALLASKFLPGTYTATVRSDQAFARDHFFDSPDTGRSGNLTDGSFMLLSL